MPCVVSRSISSCMVCPALRAWASATCGQIAMSPSIPCGVGLSGVPGVSSSMGTDSTSVAPGSSMSSMCSFSMAGSSTSRMESSACGWMYSCSKMKRANATSRASSTWMPDSLLTSMLMRALPSFPGNGMLDPVALCFVPDAVGVDDVPHQAVADDVGGVQYGEADVVDSGEDLLDDAQARARSERQVHLRDVAGDHHLGAEAEAGQEHLHLFRRGVLRLVQDDEGVVQRPAPHVGERRDFNGAGSHQAGNRLRVHHVVERVVQRPQ